MMWLRRPAVTLLVALALWAPAARALVHRDLPVDAAAARLLLALGLSWVGLALIGRVAAGYRGEDASTNPAPVAELDGPEPARRRTDPH